MNSMNSMSSKVENYWFLQPMCGLPKQAESRLASPPNKQWLQYAMQFKKMPLRIPSSFFARTTVRTLYNKLIDFCRTQCLPDDIALELIPTIINWMKSSTGYFRPLVFIGEQGCGKSTACKLICKQILGIDYYEISAPICDTSHGLFGETATFSHGDIGNFAAGMLHHNNLVVGFIVDEIDKAPLPESRSPLSHELLSACDDSNTDVQDNFLGFPLPTLKYCPIIMTANDESKINPYLLDRCTVLRFPNASLDRLEQILTKYTKAQTQTEIYNMVEVDYSLLRKTSERLLDNNIFSIRRHQQCIETALGYCLSEAMRNDIERIELTDEILQRAERKIINGKDRRKVGFGS